MTPEETQRLEAAITEIASILYKNTSPEAIENLEGIEKIVLPADALFSQSRNRLFFIEQTTGTNKGRSRQIKSCVGELSITEKQAQKLGLEPRIHLSPLGSNAILLDRTLILS